MATTEASKTNKRKELNNALIDFIEFIKVRRDIKDPTIETDSKSVLGDDYIRRATIASARSKPQGLRITTVEDIKEKLKKTYPDEYYDFYKLDIPINEETNIISNINKLVSMLDKKITTQKEEKSKLFKENQLKEEQIKKLERELEETKAKAEKIFKEYMSKK